ncbi:class I SAM-dependent methyltransferase [Streptomyces sp. N2-109]|uniref:Class I SAM-dependent methyltransferase n=1 Tax=Streptomyces gossypii TaxID=2883101 RepID=A0ABT2JVX6_9ACTN|nr:class I SAM-dependent methyltransferase [Streptomyces gossypii]MCT2591828.1 class I SAM-dependent methyltransferase [Streptomyces gossypii]
MSESQIIRWTEGDEQRSARWRSESGARPPARVALADDRTKAADAYKLACEGTALLWRGDFQNARQLLTAMARRVDAKPRTPARTPAGPPAEALTEALTDASAEPPPAGPPGGAFHRQRARQAQRARILGMLLVPLDADHTVPLRRAPGVQAACAAAYGPPEPDGEPSVLALRELLGLIGAYEWQRNGVPVPALGGDRVHPVYGVFAPVRGEYVELVAGTPLPGRGEGPAFDVGTGTGVLSAVLARRGVRHVVATDTDPRALDCARENMARLGVSTEVEVVHADLFPPGRAPLVVCNPPWIPARPTSPLEHAVYDPGSRMLRGFLAGLAGHLEPGGEGWLVLSDLAERLGLRTREELTGWIEAAGLRVAGRSDTAPRHPRAADADDPLHAARSAEVTSLWRLVAPV